MRRTSIIRGNEYRRCSAILRDTKAIQRPFSEQTIMELQEKFLSNGFRNIKVKNVQAGRAIMSMFLESLNYYNDVAALTLSDRPLNDSTLDVYRALVEGRYIDPFSNNYLDEFFTNHFYFDFMWIEAEDSLLTSGWFADFELKLVDLNIDNHIPVIIISYEDD